MWRGIGQAQKDKCHQFSLLYRIQILKGKACTGRRCGSVMQGLPGMREVLGSIPGSGERRKGDLKAQGTLCEWTFVSLRQISVLTPGGFGIHSNLPASGSKVLGSEV